ncbi:hypothetical protein PCE1_000131 [Barthelona sp. PCE]
MHCIDRNLLGYRLALSIVNSNEDISLLNRADFRDDDLFHIVVNYLSIFGYNIRISESEICHSSTGNLLHELPAPISFMDLGLQSSHLDKRFLTDFSTSKSIDEDLFELSNALNYISVAGLAVFVAIKDYIRKCRQQTAFSDVVVLVGPGNNGNDGLIATKLLEEHTSLNIHTFTPKISSSRDSVICREYANANEIYNHKESVENNIQHFLDFFSPQTTLIIDSLFGFGFKGTPRPPFISIENFFISIYQEWHIFSIDVPSFCTVSHLSWLPRALISLTCPKHKHTTKLIHYLGGRFIPDEVRDKYGIFNDWVGSNIVALLQ